METLRQVLEKVVRTAFEKELADGFAKLEKEFEKKHDDLIKDFDGKYAELFGRCRAEAKRMANSMALELLQKENIAGISLELKL